MASVSATPITRINALAELERIGVKFKTSSQNEVSVCCPVHNEQHPSLQLNTEKNLFRCMAASCGATGDIITLIAYFMKVERQVVLAELSERYDLGTTKTISGDVIERFHQAIEHAGPLLKALYDRGVTDQMIRSARIGYHDGRITIPVYDEYFHVVNVRKYLPGAPGPDKMRNTKGFAGPHLYQVKQVIENDRIWVCGGELKALVAGWLLREFKVGACAVTAGEGAWEQAFTARFKDKIVYVCMDVDAGGKVAARKVASRLLDTAKEVWIIQLPLDRDVYPKGDINDYVGGMGAGPNELNQLMTTCAKRYEHEAILEELEPKREDAVAVKLSQAAASVNVTKRIKLDAIVQAMDTTPYFAPKVVSISCDRKQAHCHECPVKLLPIEDTTGKSVMTIKPTSPGILGIIGAPEIKLREAVRVALNIPTCRSAEFHTRERYDILDVRLMPKLAVGGDNKDYVCQPAFVIGAPVESNIPYEFTGRVFPSPKNQQAVLLLDTAEHTSDSLATYDVTPEQLDMLDIFKPVDDSIEAIDAKLDELYLDFEANVTEIFQRRDLHHFTDLIYHTPLEFYFDGTRQNGWGNGIVVGDSGQGKSKVTIALMNHYGLGERFDCKNASVAGLLGGLEQLGNRWFVSWGVIPIHDKRLVVLEEVKGAHTDVTSKLTDMRSSGVAEVSKIEKRKAHARTRLIFNSNSRSNRMASDFNFGVEIIAEVMGALEDIRRFDIGMVVSASEVDENIINQPKSSRPTVGHKYTQELCKSLLMWTWTRKPEQVVFDKDAEQACLDWATYMCGIFTDKLPLVDKGTMRYKLARLAASRAARLFSHLPNDKMVLNVRACHVWHVANWLVKLYSSKVMGYLEFSKAIEYSTKVSDPNQVRKHILGTRFPKDLVESMLNADEVTLNDIQDWTGLQRDYAQQTLSFLVRKHALHRDDKRYLKTSEFVTLLKQMQTEGIPETSSLPTGQF